MPDQSRDVMATICRYSITGIALHLAGFVIGFLSIGLVLGGFIGLDSGLPALSPFADLMYGLGLVVVVAVAARAGVPMRYLLVAGAVIGIGLFYKSAPHEIHMASGIGFGMPHNGHTVLGTILITISVVAIAVLVLVRSRSRLPAYKTAP